MNVHESKVIFHLQLKAKYTDAYLLLPYQVYHNQIMPLDVGSSLEKVLINIRNQRTNSFLLLAYYLPYLLFILTQTKIYQSPKQYQ